jgi:flagellar export protein FliJ
LREIEYRLEVKRQELVKASSDTKVLEKLEENQLAEYIKNAAKEEQSFLDEIAQYQGVRNALNAA